jgi:hypothetical protein
MRLKVRIMRLRVLVMRSRVRIMRLRVLVMPLVVQPHEARVAERLQRAAANGTAASLGRSSRCRAHRGLRPLQQHGGPGWAAAPCGCGTRVLRASCSCPSSPAGKRASSHRTHAGGNINISIFIYVYIYTHTHTHAHTHAHARTHTHTHTHAHAHTQTHTHTHTHTHMSLARRPTARPHCALP